MTFTMTMEKCQHPYIVYMRHATSMKHTVRLNVLRWLRENIAREDYQIEENDTYNFFVRFRHESDATLMLLRFQGNSG